MPTPHAFKAEPDSHQPPTSYTLMQLDSGVSWSAQSRALSINNASPVQVVGIWGDNPNSGTFSNTDGFIWDHLNGLRKLTDLLGGNSGWTYLKAYGINDSGYIVGQGTNSSGQLHAFLMSPTTGPNTSGQSKPPPPDPLSAALLASPTVVPAGLPATVPAGSNSLPAAAPAPDVAGGSAANTIPPGSDSAASAVLPAAAPVDLFFADSALDLTGAFAAQATADSSGVLG